MSQLGALFYPYHPSDGAWLRHALLYYDFVATTVPAAFERQLENCALPDHLQVLRDDGQYRSSIDEVGLVPVAQWLGNLDPSFAFAAIPGAEDFGVATFLNPKFTVTDQITNESFQLGDYLAECLASLSAKPLVPSTDNERTFSHLYGSSREEGKVVKDSSLHSAYITYEKLLPTPRADTPLQKILAFKKKYGDELARLQASLAATRKKIGDNLDPEAMKLTLAEQQKELLSACADLRAALGSSSIDTTLGLLRELISAKPPVHAAFLGGAVGLAAAPGIDPMKLTPLQVALGLGVAGGVSVISAAVSLLNGRKQRLRESPHAYLYLAQRGGILGT